MTTTYPDGTPVVFEAPGVVKTVGTAQRIVINGTKGIAIPMEAASSVTTQFYSNSEGPPIDGDWVVTPQGGGWRANGKWHTPAGVTLDDAQVPLPRTLVFTAGAPYGLG